MSSDDIDGLSLENRFRLHLNIVEECPWTIQDSNIHGQGLFAARQIEEGELILKDVALVLGPRSGSARDPVCVGCLSTIHPLIPCSKLCRLPVCSLECENSPEHEYECRFLREHCAVDLKDYTSVEDGIQRDCPRNDSTEVTHNSGGINSVGIVDKNDRQNSDNVGEQKNSTVTDGTVEEDVPKEKTPSDGPLFKEIKDQCSKDSILTNGISNTSQKKLEVVDGFNLELVRSATPLRCLQMSKLKRSIMKSLESHEHPVCEVDILKRIITTPLTQEEESYLRFCCGILDTNTYGGIGHGTQRLNFRGLYALSALMNHSCVPNTTYWFDNEGRMVVKAVRRIAKNEEIFSTYTSLLWGTGTRRSFLHNTKAFHCRCLRCKDATEFGSRLSGIYCKAKPCNGVLLPSDPLNIKSDWNCDSGIKEHKITPQKAFQVLNICSKVAELLIQNEDVGQIRAFFRSVPENAQCAVQIRKHFVLQSKCQITDLTNEKFLFREECCYKLLNLIAMLKLGGNYLRGLILQDLVLLCQEKAIRFPDIQVDNEALNRMKREYEAILKS